MAKKEKSTFLGWVDIASASRSLHYPLAYFTVISLTFMSLTGGLWTIAYRWLNFDKAAVKWLLRWHQGDVLNIVSLFSDKYEESYLLRTLFCSFVGLTTLAMAITGICMINFKSMLQNRNKFRRFHQMYAFAFSVPLIVICLTGSLWAVAKYVFQYEKDSIKWMMTLHQVNFHLWIV
jgi:hypothetical protein